MNSAKFGTNSHKGFRSNFRQLKKINKINVYDFRRIRCFSRTRHSLSNSIRRDSTRDGTVEWRLSTVWFVWFCLRTSKLNSSKPSPTMSKEDSWRSLFPAARWITDQYCRLSTVSCGLACPDKVVRGTFKYTLTVGRCLIRQLRSEVRPNHKHMRFGRS